VSLLLSLNKRLPQPPSSASSPFFQLRQTTSGTWPCLKPPSRISRPSPIARASLPMLLQSSCSENLSRQENSAL
jgi:hypothetical protein